MATDGTRLASESVWSDRKSMADNCRQATREGEREGGREAGRWKKERGGFARSDWTCAIAFLKQLTKVFSKVAVRSYFLWLG